MSNVLNNRQIKYVMGGHAEYLTFAVFDKYPELGAVFAIRGTRGYHYESSTTDVDDSGIVRELGIDVRNIVIPIQEHTAKVAKYDNKVRYYKSTDGLITAERGVALGTKVADCIPLLFYDPTHHAIGNIHSGWRGTLQKIALNGARKMVEEYGTSPAELICVLCPSIRQDHFEVDEDVYKRFKEVFPQIIDEVAVYECGKYYIDAVRCNAWMLEQFGMKPENIVDSGICTVCHSDLINSYRGNRIGEKHYRNLALIWLNT